MRHLLQQTVATQNELTRLNQEARESAEAYKRQVADRDTQLKHAVAEKQHKENQLFSQFVQVQKEISLFTHHE